MTIQRLPLLKAVVEALEQDHGKPTKLGRISFVLDGQGEPTDKPDLPCTVIYGGAGLQLDGPPLGEAFADGWVPVLIRSVGKRLDQVEWMADKNHAAMLDTDSAGVFRVPITAAGLKVGGRELSNDGPADPEGDVWSLTRTYRLWVTPADTP